MRLLISVCGLLAAFIGFELRAAADERSHRLWQAIGIVSTPGAECTFHRDGHAIARLLLPETGMNFATGSARVELTESRDNITIVCARDGYVPRARVISFGPQTTIFDGAVNVESRVGVEFAYPQMVTKLILSKSTGLQN